MDEPNQIGRYRLDSLLARTDLSEVYAAHSASGTQVCVKRLLPALAVPGSEAVLAFRREAKLLAEVSHPNVVRVLEVGEDQGMPFTCLELVQGASLRERISEGRVAVLEGLTLLRQLAGGLARVHERGIVHGDLKPANVLLERRGDVSWVKLADFGLAAEAAHLSSLLSGTPHYMSPEQTRLVEWPVDARSDLYSLGVVAFELFAGKPPFDRSDPAALLAAQVIEKPPRLLELRADLPPLLEKVIFKLLEKNPAHRYKGAASLDADLERLESALLRGEAAPDFPLDTAGDLSARLGQVFVGRHAELGEMERALQSAREGRPVMLFVGGSAGVGKSTLLTEFRNRSLVSGGRFAAGKCFEFSRALPFYVLAEALTDHLQRLEQAPAAERDTVHARIRAAVGEQEGELVKLAPAFRRLFPNAKPLAYLGEGRDRQRFLQMVRGLLEALAPPQSPLVLLLEDLHWADAGTLSALEELADSLVGCALLIIGTYRDQEIAADGPMHRVLDRAERRRAKSKLELKPFDHAETTLMIAESLRQPTSAVPASLTERVQDRTGGNPLFVTEVLKALLQSGALTVEAGRLEIALENLEATQLPGSIVDIVLQRVERIDALMRGTLGAAALSGRGFTLHLATVAADVTPEAAFAAIQEGLGQKLVLPARDGVYRFYHDRVQEACARVVAENERARVHQRIVQYLEASGEQNDQSLFELAEHAERAHDAARTWRYCGAAAAIAQSRYANEQALSYYRRALAHAEAAQVPSEERRQLRAKMTEALDLLGRYQESMAEYTAILSEPLPDMERARMLAGFAYSTQKAGDYAQSKQMLVDALKLLGTRIDSRFRLFGPSGDRLRYRWARAWTRLFGPAADAPRRKLVVEILTRLFNIFSIVEAKRLPALVYRMIAEAVRLGPSRELAAAHGKMAISLPQLSPPRLAEALKEGRRSVEIARSLNSHLQAGQALVYSSAVLVWSARYREALSTLQAARETLTALGEMWDLGNAYIFSYLASRACGRIDDAMAHAHALIELGLRTAASGTIANGHGKVADLLFLRGEKAKGESHLKTCIALCEEKKLTFDRYQAHKIQGFARLRERDYAAARAQFQAAIRLNETPGVSFFRAYVSDAYLGYAEAVLLDADYLAETGGVSGNPQVVHYIRESLRRERRLKGHLAHAHKVRGFALWRRGKVTAARRALLRSMDIFASQERPVDVALCQLDAAEILGATSPEEALGWLRRARAVFSEQRLKPLVDRAQAATAKLGGEITAQVEVDESSARALQELISVTSLLMQSREPQRVFEHVVDSSISLLGAERGFLFIRNTLEGPLELVLGKNADGSRVNAHDANVSRGVIDRVDREGKGLAVSDTDQDETLRERRSVMAFQLRSVLCAALISDEKKLGVLYLDSQVTRAVFGAAELELLQSFATHAALALTNAHLFHQLEELNRSLDAKVLERTRELENTNGQLAASMTELRDTTLRLVEAKREALEKELQVARSIQLSMVPAPAVMEIPAARFYGRVEPASMCGGDFWLHTGTDARLIFLIGDVTGHGVGSAMVTATAKSCLDTLWFEQQGAFALPAMMATLNEVIYSTAKGQLVMTAFAVEVDLASHTLTFCVAGHNPQLLLRTTSAGNVLQRLSIRSHCLGDKPGAQFGQAKQAYSPGDRLILYTDGIVERVNAKEDVYGERRFRDRLTRAGPLSAEELHSLIWQDVQAFGDGAPAQDDLTLVVAQLR